MKKYRPVALYLLCMAALSGFIYLDGAVWHHAFPQGFVLFLVCLMMGLSLVLAGFTALLIHQLAKATS